MAQNSERSKRFEELYKKYLENSLSISELDELLHFGGTEDIDRLIEDPLRVSWTSIEEELLARKKEKNVFLKLPVWKWSIAAAILLVAVISVFYLQKGNNNWQLYSTAYGDTELLEMDDGSRILLNANSTLKWNSNWRKSGQRQAIIQGEAFFDVSHIEGQRDAVPFSVKSGDLHIDVIGTSFNVRQDKGSSGVYLYEGKIRLKISTLKDSVYFLEKGEEVLYDRERSIVRVKKGVSKIDAASWTEGELRYINKPLSEILEQLSRVYGKNFIVEDKTILNVPMDVGIPYSNWDVIKSALEMALSVQFEETDTSVKVKR